MPLSGRLARILVVLAAFATVPAYAEQVVVLELPGDRGGMLRQQIEAALTSAGKVERVSLERYRAAAARKGFRGTRAMTAEAVAAVSEPLALDAAVTGTLGERYSVLILDAAGEKLWSRELPLAGGKLSDDHARRLAAAIHAAAKKGRARRSADVAGAPTAEEPAPPVPPDGSAPSRQPAGGLDLTGEDGSRPVAVEVAGSERVPLPVEATAIDERPSSPHPAPGKPRSPGPTFLTVGVQGTTSWRSYCARPGVTSCREYDLLEPGNLPAGSPRQFDTRFPYSGAKLSVEVFPAASLEHFARGFGFVGDLRLGLSITDIFNVSGEVRTRIGTELGQDRGFSAAVAYRHHFSFGADPERFGYLGARAGAGGRGFRLGGTVVNQIPPTDRLFPELAVEVLLPLNRWVRVDALGGYFFGPSVAPDDHAAYGVVARSSGWSASIGLSGDVWGFLGYVVRFEHAQFEDRFEGRGLDWTEGGVATETYSSVTWGLSAQL